MIQLFNQTALECSKLITERYSTSFTLGIRTLDNKFHFPIYAIYGFVRYADEIVDTFHQYDKKFLLDKFRYDTYEAINQKISLNPVLHAFQLVVNQYHIERELIDAFLHSMEMDLAPQEYDESFTDEATVVEKYGTAVFLTEGDYNNIKITRPVDMMIAERIIEERSALYMS